MISRMNNTQRKPGGRATGFAGPIHLVNPDFAEIDGMRAVPTLADLPVPPDVAIVATPPPTVPTVIAQAAEAGCAAAVIITAGLGHGRARSPKPPPRRPAPAGCAWSGRTASA